MTEESRLDPALHAVDAPQAHGLASGRRRRVATLVVGAAGVAAALWTIDDPTVARACAIAVAYLVLALSEAVPPFVPTLLLLTATPLSLGSFDDRFRLGAVLSWTADPVLALFAGGLALGLAARHHGVDTAIAATVVRLSRGSRRALVGLLLTGTALMSMWMSNIAAAAVMFTALRPLLAHGTTPAFRAATLLAVAVGANLGGIGTPIGTGPNALAISASAGLHRITFVEWMAFAVPLVVALLVVAWVLLVLRYRVAGTFHAHLPARLAASGGRPTHVVIVFAIGALAWLSEPVHGIPAPLVGLLLMLTLFGTGLLPGAALKELDWSTLGLIAGGLSLGRLFEASGVLETLGDAHRASALPPHVTLLVLVFAAALLSAVMSNTATAAMLIPLALSGGGTPATAVLVAVAASFGMPFTISTPPNAMAYGEGGLRTSDLLWIGLTLMVGGCAVVWLTGERVLQVFGVP